MIAIDPDLVVPRGALPKRALEQFVREVCAAIPLHGEVSILFATDAAVQELNRSFRRKNKPTDVLSFPATPIPGLPDTLAGDLAVSIDTARRQAEAFAHPLLVEVKILLLHGLLHLAGFDHEQDSGRMARRERLLRTRFELPLGLIQRTVARPAPAKTPARVLSRRAATPDARLAAGRPAAARDSRPVARPAAKNAFQAVAKPAARNAAKPAAKPKAAATARSSRPAPGAATPRKVVAP
ncbi:rRNA maturation RNase YbeY [Acidipila sp. EB88]|uniref:rRNA maturation RNase YbeY n=1 Tax=Acidipila sp. EB88 TaxID=2305226 RepID=UPI000F5EDF08|nr:rRNA maturation RNase YbeY [Acidipila sp. EB88]RRA47776.1 rRNA maturation RNase YbeY [Acidipila sp. EB88]